MSTFDIIVIIYLLGLIPATALAIFPSLDNKYGTAVNVIAMFVCALFSWVTVILQGLAMINDMRRED